MRPWAPLLLVARGALVGGDFVFVDFNETQGLRLNGDAETSACAAEAGRAHGPDERGAAPGALPAVQATTSETKRVETADTLRGGADDAPRAGLLHRDAYAYAPAPARCAGRLRLTPPRPHARGSAWHHLRRPVARGFEATFTFQLAAPTRRCAVHRDLDFSLALYERCAVRGGDGLAFVVADDPNGTAALGAAGGGLGYAGLRRALVVELDADYSPPADGFAADHVELRSAGAGAVDGAAPAHRLAPPAAWDLADGREHLVRVAYAPSVPARYAGNLSAYPAAARYAVDGGEARRLGLVTVFLDDGVAADRPALAVPLNLPEALGLPGDGTAHVGLTAATGERWQAHDVTSWAVCDRPGRDAVP